MSKMDHGLTGRRRTHDDAVDGRPDSTPPFLIHVVQSAKSTVRNTIAGELLIKTIVYIGDSPFLFNSHSPTLLSFYVFQFNHLRNTS